MEIKQLPPSRMEEAKTNKNVVIRKKTGVWRHVYLGVKAFVLYLLLGTTAWIYYLLGSVIQRIDPTAGWLDIGTLSLPLFAAWSSLLGIGITGLLPVIIGIIGRKGGMEKWKADKNGLWQVVIYVGYIALLCVLL